MKFRCRGAQAFTLIEIMIVVALIGLLAAIAVPSFVRARLNAQKNTCINNLRVLDAVKQQWALEARKQGTDLPNEADLLPYIMRGSSGRVPVCPSAGTSATLSESYEINEVATPPACKIVPAEHKMPNS